MIIEFNGLPGTGKSTTANELKAQLERRGIKCYNTFDTSNGKLLKKIRYVFNGTYWLLYLSINFVKNCVKTDEIDKYEVLGILTKFYNIYRDFNKIKPKDVLIIDQGLVQGVLSLVHTGEITDTKGLEKIIRFLKKKNIEFVSVDCICSKELCVDRINKRGRAYGRVDSKSKTEMQDILNLQEQTLQIIRGFFDAEYPFVEIMTTDTIDVNVSRIVEFTETEVFE